MPRHRKECTPRNRTQSQDDKPGRRVPVSAAIDAAKTALGAGPENGQDGEEPGSAGQPRFPRTRRLRLTGAGAGGPRLRGQGRPSVTAASGQQRRMRGLLVTPWFAAGAGFVIAAGLALNSPHTVLTYGPNTQLCLSHCTKQPKPSAGSELNKPGAVQVRPTQTARARHSQRPAPTGHGRVKTGPAPGSGVGAQLGFTVRWTKYGQFGAMITLPAGQATHDWSLRFEIPGVQISGVLGGASVQLSAGGTEALVTGPATQRPPGGQPGPGGSPGGHHHRYPHPHHHWHGGYGQASPAGRSFLSPDQLWVYGSGKPGSPVACELNGTACHFG
jgi:hypothetical protein